MIIASPRAGPRFARREQPLTAASHLDFYPCPARPPGLQKKNRTPAACRAVHRIRARCSRARHLDSYPCARRGPPRYLERRSTPAACRAVHRIRARCSRARRRRACRAGPRFARREQPLTAASHLEFLSVRPACLPVPRKKIDASSAAASSSNPCELLARPRRRACRRADRRRSRTRQSSIALAIAAGPRAGPRFARARAAADRRQPSGFLSVRPACPGTSKKIGRQQGGPAQFIEFGSAARAPAAGGRAGARTGDDRERDRVGSRSRSPPVRAPDRASRGREQPLTAASHLDLYPCARRGPPVPRRNRRQQRAAQFIEFVRAARAPAAGGRAGARTGDDRERDRVGSRSRSPPVRAPDRASRGREQPLTAASHLDFYPCARRGPPGTSKTDRRQQRAAQFIEFVRAARAPRRRACRRADRRRSRTRQSWIALAIAASPRAGPRFARARAAANCRQPSGFLSVRPAWPPGPQRTSTPAACRAVHRIRARCSRARHLDSYPCARRGPPRSPRKKIDASSVPRSS